MEAGKRQWAIGPLVIGGLTLAAMAVASFLPELRLWGLAGWARVPLSATVGAVALGAVLMFIGWLLVPRLSKQAVSSKLYRIGIIGTALLAGMAFYLLRTKTHFLGDGYTALSLLASETPLIKTREIGESLFHIWVKNLSGLEGESAALFSFRFLSILAGMVLVGFVGWSASRLFDDIGRRVLFAAGMLTGGYMLLFFGYVENYSLFVMSVVAWAMVGLLVSRGQIARWWLLLPPAGAIVFHILGVTLIPSAVYLLLAPMGIGRRVKRMRVGTRVVLGAVLLVGLVGGLVMAAQNNVFLRYSLVSLIEDPFTIDGYTLFSFAHVADFLNLLFLLLPGMGLLTFVLVKTTRAGTLSTRDVMFLLVLSLSTLGAVLIFDPKLGMPRDWDLFAFAGVGPVALLYLLTLDRKFGITGGLRIAGIAVMLGLFSLGGRVMMVNTPEVMIARFHDYIELDPKRDRNGRYLLVAYYKERGDNVAADLVREEWKAAFPVREKLNKAYELKIQGEFAEAAALFETIVREDAVYGDAWSNLGEIMIRYQFYDSALACLNMAVGLNPYDASAYSNRSVVHLYRGDFTSAARDLSRAIEIDSTNGAMRYNLAMAYRQSGRSREAEEEIRRMAALPNLVWSEHVKLFEWYAGSGRVPPAIDQLRQALGKGADTAYVRGLVQRYPAVEQALRR